MTTAQLSIKTCKQCGKILPIDMYRKYYNGRKGRYTTCLNCERINTRAKYLALKERTPEEDNELSKTLTLYNLQRGIGLRPPSMGATQVPVSKLPTVDDFLDDYNKTVSAIIDMDLTMPPEEIPYDLRVWLVCDLTKHPDTYINTIYDQLFAKYSAQIGLDEDSLLPIFDDTYKEILQTILDRFFAYEDAYYKEDKSDV